MTIERTGIFNFHGDPVTVIGPDLKVGQMAPEFRVDSKDWSSLNALESTQDKVRIIGSLPSLSSPTCNIETRRFNQEAAALDEDVVILMVSMDLPWTLREWCAAAGVDRVVTLSDHRDANFGQKYGVFLKEPRIHRRSIFVVDRLGKIVYADYMPVLGDQPRYEEVLSAARMALAES
jgi:thioredoxin-dependent peroxiredoxin